jgi:hypothetical protein
MHGQTLADRTSPAVSAKVCLWVHTPSSPVRERDREIKREKGREIKREKGREIKRERERDKEREGEREGGRER